MLISVKDAAERLGVSARTVYDLAAPAGPIPCHRIGARILFNKEDITEYLQSCRFTETKRAVATFLNSTASLRVSGGNTVITVYPHKQTIYGLRLVREKPYFAPTASINPPPAHPNRWDFLCPLTNSVYGKNTDYLYSKITMLTYRDLKAIQEGNRRNADVMELLREVKRLRLLAVEARTTLGKWSINTPSADLIAEVMALTDKLRVEPCVTEDERMRERAAQLEINRKIAMQDNRPPSQRPKDDTP